MRSELKASAAPASFARRLFDAAALTCAGRLFVWRTLLQAPATRAFVDFSAKVRLHAGARLQLGRGARVGPWNWIDVRAGARFEMGEGSRLARSCEVVVADGAELIVGRNVSLNSFANIRANRRIFIGDGVLLAQSVSIIGGQYELDAVAARIGELPVSGEDVVIEEGCWLGCGVVVLPGVNIGRGAVIGAGAVVTKDVAEGSIVAGIPAKVIGWRKDRAK
jgi:acetyltransferase-like isoleucine patch superfamily enzyme